MATGDDAIAAGMDVVAGTVQANTIDTEITKTRDYIAQRTSAVQPVVKGGTGSTNAAAARAALGVTPDNIAAPNTAVPGLKFTSPSFGRISYEAPGVAFPTSIPLPGDVDAALAAAASATSTANAASTGANNAYARADEKVAKGGDTVTGQLFFPNATAATAGFAVAYINGDGRLSRNSSSERYKKFVSPADALALGDIFPELVRYQIRTGDGSWQLGYIAERLAEHPEQERFVVRYGDPEKVESIDFIQMLMAQVAQLHARVIALEAG